jgi:hypothetical protein
MPLILAIEPDRRQASRVAALAKGPLGSLHVELLVAESAEQGLAALGARVPDLILTAQLLLPKDEAALADRLRALDDAGAHVQTLVIPLLGSTGKESGGGGGLLGRLRRSKKDVSTDGCDPAVFAQQIVEYLDRAAAERVTRAAENEEQGAETPRKPVRPDEDAPPDFVEPPTEFIEPSSPQPDVWEPTYPPPLADDPGIAPYAEEPSIVPHAEYEPAVVDAAPPYEAAPQYEAAPIYEAPSYMDAAPAHHEPVAYPQSAPVPDEPVAPYAQAGPLYVEPAWVAPEPSSEMFADTVAQEPVFVEPEAVFEPPMFVEPEPSIDAEPVLAEPVFAEPEPAFAEREPLPVDRALVVVDSDSWPERDPRPEREPAFEAESPGAVPAEYWHPEIEVRAEAAVAPEHAEEDLVVEHAHGEEDSWEEIALDESDRAPRSRTDSDADEPSVVITAEQIDLAAFIAELEAVGRAVTAQPDVAPTPALPASEPEPIETGPELLLTWEPPVDVPEMEQVGALATAPSETYSAQALEVSAREPIAEPSAELSAEGEARVEKEVAAPDATFETTAQPLDEASAPELFELPEALAAPVEDPLEELLPELLLETAVLLPADRAPEWQATDETSGDASVEPDADAFAEAAGFADFLDVAEPSRFVEPADSVEIAAFNEFADALDTLEAAPPEPDVEPTPQAPDSVAVGKGTAAPAAAASYDAELWAALAPTAHGTWPRMEGIAAEHRVPPGPVTQQREPAPERTLAAKAIFKRQAVGKPVRRPAAEPTFVPAAEPRFVPAPEPTFVPVPEPTFVPAPEPTFVLAPEPVMRTAPEPVFASRPPTTFVPRVEPAVVTPPEPVPVAVVPRATVPANDAPAPAAATLSAGQPSPGILAPATVPAPERTPTPADTEAAQPEWVALLTSIKHDIQQLKADRIDVTPAAEAQAPPDQAEKDKKKRRADKPEAKPAQAAKGGRKKKAPVPVQDEWGFFDPAQCGFAALLEKLDEITDDEVEDKR